MRRATPFAPIHAMSGPELGAMETLAAPAPHAVGPFEPAATQGAVRGTLRYDRDARTAEPRGEPRRPVPSSDRPAAAEGRLPQPDEAQAQRRAEDAALIARIVDRDERAVEALYARYSGPLYSLAYQVTHAERFAQDVVQEVFVALWRDASRFDPTKGAVAPWLFSLARHKAIDLVRREANVRN